MDHVKIEELLAFRSVGETGSYAMAARLLGKDTSVISRRITALEETLGVQLVRRTSKHVSLTVAGSSYLVAVANILADLESANQQAAALASSAR